MAEYATKEDVQEVVGKAVDDLSRTVDSKFEDFSKKFDAKLGKAVGELSGIIGTLAQQMGDAVLELKRENQEIKDTLNRFINTVDGFMKRLDEIETEQVARDRQVERLIAWAHKVSEKTGIPLENL